MFKWAGTANIVPHEKLAFFTSCNQLPHNTLCHGHAVGKRREVPSRRALCLITEHNRANGAALEAMLVASANCAMEFSRDSTGIRFSVNTSIERLRPFVEKRLGAFSCGQRLSSSPGKKSVSRFIVPGRINRIAEADFSSLLSVGCGGIPSVRCPLRVRSGRWRGA